jgi:hypothetical protein
MHDTYPEKENALQHASGSKVSPLAKDFAFLPRQRGGSVTPLDHQNTGVIGS